MRGLTDEERAALTTAESFPDETIERLVKRGVLRSAGYYVCCSCGCCDDSCACEGDEQEEFEATPEGHLALRLDSAARALEGVAS
jgi:hypothetical protein